MPDMVSLVNMSNYWRQWALDRWNARKARKATDTTADD